MLPNVSTQGKDKSTPETASAPAGGFIVIHRVIFDSWVMTLRDPEQIVFTIWLILRANWKAGKMFTGGEMVVIPRGSFWTSLDSLAEQYSQQRRKKLSRSKTGRWLSALEKAEFLKQEMKRFGRLITVENYGTYQDVSARSETQSETEVKRKWNGSGTNRTRTTSTTRTAVQSTSDFDLFWSAYPKRKGTNPKKPARDKFARLVRDGVDAAMILRGAQNYARHMESTGAAGTPYVKQAITWLNQELWNEYQEEIFSDPPSRNTFAAANDPEHAHKFDGFETEYHVPEPAGNLQGASASEVLRPTA